MSQTFWSASLVTYLWQVALHSWVMGLIFYVWVHRVALPSGRTKRQLLALVLVLPQLSAAMPGRATPGFGERAAWLDTARLLAVPRPWGLRVTDVIVALGVLATLITIWQELLVWRGRPRASADPVPEPLADAVRAEPGWSDMRVALTSSDAVVLATSGWPGRMRLLVSDGAQRALTPPELALVIAHERAHADTRRWLASHLLFAVRLLQCYNPIALWAFREYCVELEIACDALAVRDRDPRDLARILLTLYQSTDRRDLAARGTLRKRVDVLLAGGPDDAALPAATMVAAALVMLLVLPWIV